MKEKNKVNKKAQVGVWDLLAAVFLFVILMTVIMIYWYDYNRDILTKLENENALSTALSVTDNLIKTPGKPTAWNTTNVQVFGLAVSDRELSEEKVEQFCNLTNSSYNQSRTLMNLMHQFHFLILTYEAGDWSKKEIECGIAPYGNIIKVVSITRAVIYKNQEVLLKFELWK